MVRPEFWLSDFTTFISTSYSIKLSVRQNLLEKNESDKQCLKERDAERETEKERKKEEDKERERRWAWQQDELA
jgi:hypothetical protein